MSSEGDFPDVRLPHTMTAVDFHWLRNIIDGEVYEYLQLNCVLQILNFKQIGRSFNHFGPISCRWQVVFLQASSQATIAVDGEKMQFLTAAYTTPSFMRTRSTVDLGDPIVVHSGHNYEYSLLKNSSYTPSVFK